MSWGDIGHVVGRLEFGSLIGTTWLGVAGTTCIVPRVGRHCCRESMPGHEGDTVQVVGATSAMQWVRH